MQTVNLAGINISNISKTEFLDEIDRLIKNKNHSYVVTPYSEFIVRAQKDQEFKTILNQADISTADGIGIQLGIKYFTMKGIYFPMIKCLASIFFNRNFLKDSIKQKLSGSEFIYDVCERAANNKYKVFLLGGYDFGNGNTGVIAKQVLEKIYQDLEIIGTYAGSPSESEETDIINKINALGTQILFIAYGPIKQEKWIYRNRNKLSPMVSFCVGGTFDFVAGEKKKVSKTLSDRGFEGILRPFVSERGNLILIVRRMKRAWLGILLFILTLIKVKRKTHHNN